MSFFLSTGAVCAKESTRSLLAHTTATFCPRGKSKKQSNGWTQKSNRGVVSYVTLVTRRKTSHPLVKF